MNDTPETDAFSGKLEDWINFAEKLERERDEARKEIAKLRDISERAVELAVQYYDGPCERDAAKLRAELDQIKEGAK